MIGRLFNGLAAIAGAASSAQFPAFFQQYLQRLGGRLDQTHDDLQKLLADAQALGLSLESYLDDLKGSGTETARQTAQRELERLDQAEQLEQAYYALRDAGPLERPMAFVQHLDTTIVEDTLAAFKPALPVTSEGLVYAGVGMLIGLILLAGGERSGRAVGRRVRHRFKRGARGREQRARPRFNLQSTAAAEPHAGGATSERSPASLTAEREDKPRRREPSLRYGGEQSHG